MRFFFIVQAVLGLLAFGSYALPTCTYAGTLEKRTSGKQLQVRAAPAPPVGSDVDVAYPVAVEPAGHPETRSSSKPQRVWTEEDYRPGPVYECVKCHKLLYNHKRSAKVGLGLVE